MKKNIENIDVYGKRVLVRVGFNVPLRNGFIEDNYRIFSALPTLKYLMGKGARLILLSHLGRPKGKVDERYSLEPVAKELNKLLGNNVVTQAQKTIGKEIQQQANHLKNGEILLLQNLRFHKEETSKDPEQRRILAKELAKLGDIYVNDAFGAVHRAHASVSTITEFLPSAMGFLMQKELYYWDQVQKNPRHPFVLLLGGAKVADKVPIIENLIDKVDHILIGGGMAYTFLAALGHKIGQSLVEKDLLQTCADLLKKYGNKIGLPIDVKVGKMDFGAMKLITPLQEIDLPDNPGADFISEELEGLDIGSKTCARFEEVLSKAKMIVWNGPMGVFECPETAKSTFKVTQCIANVTSPENLTIVGGGDSASAVKKAGKEKNFSHISTGGGASLEMLQGKTLPGIAAIEDLK